jgi:uncharacterized HAD superfamily protein
MRDIVGLDLDSVLADTEIALDKFIREEFGIQIDWDNEITSYKLEDMPRLNEIQSKHLIKSVNSGRVLMEIPVHNYAEYATKKLCNEGFDICIITSRPASLYDLTRDWLDKHDLVYNDLRLVPSTDKWQIVASGGISAFVEDRASILKSVYERCGTLEYGLYGVKHPWNKKYENDKIVWVDDVAEAVDKIVEFRKWKNFFLTECVGNIEKFIKEYQDGK